MKVQILFGNALFATVVSNFINTSRLWKTNEQLDRAEERIAELKDKEKQPSNSIVALGEGYKTLEERFTQEVQQEIEARTDKERREAEAQKLFNEGLQSIIDFDGGAQAKGEK